MEKGNIIVTFDDVIANTSYDLYSYLKEHFYFYNYYFNIFKLYTKKDINNRDKLDIFKWLIKDNISNFDLVKINLNLELGYYKNINYEKIITNLGNNGIGNKMVLTNSGIDKIHVLIKYKNKYDKNEKERVIKKLYGDKAECLFLTYNDEYYNIFKNIVSWNIVITDDIDFIEKIASGNIDHKEFLLPNYGYNKLKPELKELIKQKAANIGYYEN